VFPGSSPKMKSLMNAKIRMTMEIWPRKKAQRAFMTLCMSFGKLGELYW
jgi:hypothetical protein